MSGSGRPNRHRVGGMRHRCTIQQVTETQDASGQPVVSWTDYVENEPCDYLPRSAYEGARGRQVEAGVTAVFIVRYRSGYNEKMSVVFDSERYGITSIQKVDGLNRYLEISGSSLP